MAGIGFELYKILHKGTLSSIFKVFLLGAIIVAGPWVLSVVSIYIIQKYATRAIAENPNLFTVTIVYVYAFSLLFFGGVHYVFSRYIADMIYEEKHSKIPPALVSIFLLVIGCSTLISVVFLSFNDFSFVKDPWLYRIAFVVLFIAINLIWLMLIYVALLKAYYKIFFSYMAGVAVSVFGVLSLGELYGVAGALLGYAAGQFLIVLLLLFISNKSYPLKVFSFSREIFSYFRKFSYLVLIGMFFNLGIWIDKIIYWVAKGKVIKGTLYFYFIHYDIPVFLGFLSMIPGLVYFLVVSESIFHRSYFTFIKNVMTDTFEDITRNKNEMIASFKKGFRQLLLFQGVWTMGIFLNTDRFLHFMGYTYIDKNIMRVIFIAVFFHMVALTLQLYMLYLELRTEALVSTIIYFSVNILLTLVFIKYSLAMPGISYLIAALVSSLFCGYHLIRKIKIIDYIIFNRT